MTKLPAYRRGILAERRGVARVPTDRSATALRDIAGGMEVLLADVFAVYMKTKSLHWHMSGPHFRDYHLLLDEPADELFSMTDNIAERIRQIGGSTLRSIGHVARLPRISVNDAAYVDPASYPHTSGVYNLMMSGGEYGSQKGWGAEPSVHE